jgi:hypothetical protein
VCVWAAPTLRVSDILSRINELAGKDAMACALLTPEAAMIDELVEAQNLCVSKGTLLLVPYTAEFLNGQQSVYSQDVDEPTPAERWKGFVQAIASSTPLDYRTLTQGEKETQVSDDDEQEPNPFREEESEEGM